MKRKTIVLSRDTAIEALKGLRPTLTALGPLQKATGEMIPTLKAMEEYPEIDNAVGVLTEALEHMIDSLEDIVISHEKGDT